jgi:hypothetical protein
VAFENRLCVRQEVGIAIVECDDQCAVEPIAVRDGSDELAEAHGVPESTECLELLGEMLPRHA